MVHPVNVWLEVVAVTRHGWGSTIKVGSWKISTSKPRLFFLNRKKFGAINEKIKCRRRSADRPHKKTFKRKQMKEGCRRDFGGNRRVSRVWHTSYTSFSHMSIWVRFPQFVAPRPYPKRVSCLLWWLLSVSAPSPVVQPWFLAFRLRKQWIYLLPVTSASSRRKTVNLDTQR